MKIITTKASSVTHKWCCLAEYDTGEGTLRESRVVFEYNVDSSGRGSEARLVLYRDTFGVAVPCFKNKTANEYWMGLEIWERGDPSEGESVTVSLMVFDVSGANEELLKRFRQDVVLAGNR